MLNSHKTRRVSIRRFVTVSLLLALGVGVGCYVLFFGTSRVERRARVFPVEGILLVGDTPVTEAQLAFHALDEEASGQACPVGITHAGGKFHLTTYSSDDGAPAGDYIVTVFWPNHSIPFDECGCLDFTIHDRLGGKYADPATSTLRATVRPDGNKIVIHVVELGRAWNLPRSSETREGARPRVP